MKTETGGKKIIISPKKAKSCSMRGNCIKNTIRRK